MLPPTCVEGLLRFAESTALQRDPTDTYPTRLVLLRVLVSAVGPEGSEPVLAALEERGVAIGAYDRDVLALHHARGLLGLVSEDWLALYTLLAHADMAALDAALAEHHGMRAPRSAVARIKTTLAVATHGTPDSAVVLAVFFAIYNTEVDRAGLVRRVLQQHRVPQHVDVALELFSQSLAAAVDSDLALVLALSWVADERAHALAFVHTRALRLELTTAAQRAQARAGRARPSLLLLRATGAGAGARARATTRPVDFPVDDAIWADLSAGQQNALLYFGLTAPRHDAPRMREVLHAIVPRLALDLATYEAHPSQHARALPALLAFLERAGVAVDHHAHAAVQVVRAFCLALCASLVAESVTREFSLAFMVQLYLAAFLPASLHADLYESLATTLNTRMARGPAATELLPPHLPDAMRDRIAHWTAQHTLDPAISRLVIHRVCL